MALTKWNNGNTFPDLLEDFFGRDLFEMDSKHTLPAVNIKETKDDFILEVAAPGMKKNDFNIQIENDMLIISSEKEHKSEQKDSEGKYTKREFSYQSFHRSFTLPQTVKEDQITAKYEDGILNIAIPKKEEAKQRPARQIKIS